MVPVRPNIFYSGICSHLWGECEGLAPPHTHEERKSNRHGPVKGGTGISAVLKLCRVNSCSRVKIKQSHENIWEAADSVWTLWCVCPVVHKKCCFHSYSRNMSIIMRSDVNRSWTDKEACGILSHCNVNANFPFQLLLKLIVITVSLSAIFLECNVVLR